FFKKVARFAVSKMAAFCYAVAVGVAGNLVFNYVQTHQAAPSVAALPHEAPAPAEKSPPVVPTATPSVMPAAAMIAKPPAGAPVAPSTPIALLPDPKTASPEAADKPPPVKPGPGSGGLY